jgi:integrase/recombinase XerD
VRFEVHIKEYFDQFVRERQFIQNVTPATLEWYHTAWTRFGPYIEKATNEADLRVKIKEAMIAVSSKGTLSPESVNTYFRVCQTFCNWLLENDIIKKQIKIARLRVPRKILETLNDAQIQRIIRFVPQTRVQRRMHALAVLILDTGIRRNEAATLTKDHVDLQNLQIKVDGKGRRERMVPISPECRKVLAKWMVRDVPPGAPFIFCGRKGQKLGDRNALRDLRRMAARCGVWTIGLHFLRHTFASSFMRNGGSVTDLQKILGHSSIQTTIRYCHALIGDLKVSNQRFSPIAKLG